MRKWEFIDIMGDPDIGHVKCSCRIRNSATYRRCLPQEPTGRSRLMSRPAVARRPASPGSLGLESASQQTENKSKSEVKGSVYVAVGVAAIGGLLFGYDTGVISGAIIFIKTQFSLSAYIEEIVVSSVLAGPAASIISIKYPLHPPPHAWEYYRAIACPLSPTR
jgi:hypothetical protein